MGKKGKRTRWRTLTLNGQESDSESSGTTSSFKFSKTYQPKYSKYSYSSQSTPTRKFQYEGKSTRSSSTASEQKITFNEDEYTRITTPRQDVLFKKGYLSKPKNYHTQTSTGTISSTANSTSTCTPDHHSADGAEGTDIEYESQFVFPNVFVDQNGIYYLNSLEPFPFVVYNAPPTYYPPEYPNPKIKRYSTDSAVESISPNTEEVTGNGGSSISGVPVFRQDLLQSPATSVDYVPNGTSQNDVQTDQHSSSNENRRLKKRRRKRFSTVEQSQEGPASSEHTDNYDSDEVVSQSEETESNSDETSRVHENLQSDETSNQTQQTVKEIRVDNEDLDSRLAAEKNENCDNEEDQKDFEKNPQSLDDGKSHIENSVSCDNLESNNTEDKTHISLTSIKDKDDVIDENPKTETSPGEDSKASFQLKPDAEEFVPRALRHPQHVPLNPALQFVNLPPTYMPIPIINPIGSIPPTPSQPFSPVFLPPHGLPPLNIIPPSHDNNITRNYHQPVQNVDKLGHAAVQERVQNDGELKPEVEKKQTESQTCNNVDGHVTSNNRIDIAQIVHKLEEAAKEQDLVKPQQSNQKSFSKFSKTAAQRTFYNGNRHRNTGNEQYKSNYYKRNELSHKNNERKTVIEKDHTFPKSPNVQKNMVNGNEHGLSETSGKSSEGNTERKMSINTNQNKSSNPEKSFDEEKQHHQSPVNYSRVIGQQTSSKNSPTRKERTPNFSDKGQSNFRNYNNNNQRQQAVKKGVENRQKSINTIPNQWINVSNRKKRRNKNAQEDVEVCDNESESLELVSVSEVVVDEVLQLADENIDIVLASEVVAVSEEKQDENEVEIKMVEEVEIKITEIETEETRKNEVEAELKMEIKSEEGLELPKTIITEKMNNGKSDKKNQNKNGKKNQKTPIKKIMITDPDMSDVSTVKITEIIEEVEVVSNDPVECFPQEKTEDSCAKEIQVEEDKSDLISTASKSVISDDNVSKTSENSEKKIKKKKKKVLVKNSLNKSTLSALNTSAIKNINDPYNDLLEGIILKDGDNKTNEEVSEELNKLIQKGMYNSLEEKLKTIKVSNCAEDEFFKVANFDGFLETEKTPKQSNSSMKLTDFTSALKNSIFGGRKSEKGNKIETTFPQVMFPSVEKLPQPSTSRSGIFLENPETSELIKTKTNNSIDVDPPLFQICMVEHVPIAKSKSSQKLKCKNRKSKTTNESTRIVKLPEIDQEPVSNGCENVPNVQLTNGDSSEPENLELQNDNYKKGAMTENGKDSLYPITQAVKEWMNKTRENTPDVEILKSPDVILKELVEIDSEIDTDTENTAKIITEQNGDTKIIVTEEVTLFSANEDWTLSPQTSIEEEDLLECWDNELLKNSNNRESNWKIINGNKNGFRNGYLDEDVIEEYESKYGRNEDFLKLKAEIEEKKKQMNFPKHGNLPYRAICCNVM